MTFKKWFDDMQERYQASYSSYEELLQEAFEAGAKQEREACANVCDELQAPPHVSDDDMSMWDVTSMECADAIRARGEA